MDTQVFLLTAFDAATSATFVSLLVGIGFILILLKIKPLPKGAKFAALGMVIAVLGLLSWVFFKAHDANIRVTPTSMTVDIPLYRTELPLESLLISQARIVSLDDADAPQLSYRSNGVGLPGYRLGWFKLKDTIANSDRALLSVTNSNHVLVLPTTEGYLLILSVERAESLLALLLASTL
ncbi:hypothetical protein TUM4644_11460 [Shewanella colwelliana]|uniref:Bacterial Pleckstrin homology domain-containing protein n=1 Tax=Shewanella colwelliana TaxID=23 RepID=A0ABQ4NWQ5_SHECO|nr:hypothetical protein [Shewanella colwelliana]GIU20990.1 hypothetical protein TUM4644_11460 [Shewanella colwelliana]GIU38361.1 hypothetical protein TUM3794_10690 [Shewanella colwelliana]